MSTSRRDFLKIVGGAAFLAAVKGSGLLNQFQSATPEPVKQPEHINDQLDLRQLDIINNPEYWLGSTGEQFQGELTQRLCTEFKNMHPHIREAVIKDQNYDIGDFNQDIFYQGLDQLLQETKLRASIVIFAKENNLNLEPDATERYYELASFAQMLISDVNLKNEIGPDSFAQMTLATIKDEQYGDLEEAPIDHRADRKQNFAVWNYNWQAFNKYGTSMSLHERVLLFDSSVAFTLPFGFKGDQYLMSPSLGGNHDPHDKDGQTVGELLVEPPLKRGRDIFHPPFPPKQSIDLDPDLFNTRPRPVKIINFDPEVAEAIRQGLSALKLERSISELKIVIDPHLSAVTTTSSDISEVDINHPQAETLDLNAYHQQEKSFDYIIIHEDHHNIRERAKFLTVAERLWLRSLDNDILAIADPLADMSRIFTRLEDDHDYVLDNERSLNRYYFQNLANSFDNMGASLSDFMFEFDIAIIELTGENIWETFSVTADDKNMDGYFARLKLNFDNYTGVTKLIAKNILDNSATIFDRTPVNHLSYNDSIYNDQVILPFTVAHLVLYHSDQIAAEMLPEKHPIENGLTINFLNTFKKRLRAFVRNGPSEELLSNLFSAAMLTKKYGPHPVGYVNDILPIFEKWLDIFRANQLVAAPDTKA